MAGDTLTRICADKRDHIARKKAGTPLAALEARLGEASAPRGFRKALATRTVQGLPALIAEVKKAASSIGFTREHHARPSSHGCGRHPDAHMHPT